MPHNLTFTGATFSASGGPFAGTGYETGGNGASATGVLTTLPISFRIAFRLSTNVQRLLMTIASTRPSWFGIQDGQLGYSLANGVKYVGAPGAYDDGAEHWMVATFDVGTIKFYVDGSLLATEAVTLDLGTGAYRIGGYTQPGYDFDGQISQAAWFDHIIGPAIPTSALVGNEAGLIAAYPLSADGSDIKGAMQAATSIAFSPSPASGPAGAALPFTISVNGTQAGGTVALSDGGKGGTFNPTSVTLASGSSAMTSFSYTPAATGSVMITASVGSLSGTVTVNVSSAAASALILTPASASVQAGAQSYFTISANGAQPGGSVTLSDGGSGGTFSPAVPVLPYGPNSTIGFVYMPVTTGLITIMAALGSLSGTAAVTATAAPLSVIQGFLRGRLLNGVPRRITVPSGTFQAPAGTVPVPPPPPVTVSAITLSPASGVANSAGGTVIGSFTATSSVALVNPVWTLLNSASGDFQVVGGTHLAFLPNNVPAGTYSVTPQVSADNLASPYSQAVAVTVTAAQTSGGSGVYATSAMPDYVFPTNAPANALINQRSIPIDTSKFTAGSLITPRLSGATFHQLTPVDSATSDATEVGNVVATGGLPPYKYTVSGDVPSVGFCTRGPTGAPQGQNSTGVIALFGPPKTTGFSGTITDARGDTITFGPFYPTFQANVGYSVNDILSFTTAVSGRPSFGPRNFVPNAPAITHIAITNSGDGSTSTDWAWDGGGTVNYVGAMPPAVTSWALAVAITTGQGVQTLGIPLNCTQAPAAQIEFVYDPNASTATLPYMQVGAIRAMTPNNRPLLSVTDQDGTLYVVHGSGELRTTKMFASAGDRVFTAKAVDGSSVVQTQFTLPVIAGTLQPASAMSWSPSSTPLDNYQRGQAVGSVSVTGMTNPAWFLSYDEYYPGMELFAITGSGNTATITAPGMLDASDIALYKLQIIAVSGTTICQTTVPISAIWHVPANPVIYVGTGYSTNPPTTHGAGLGFETFAALKAAHLGGRYAPGGSGGIDPAIAGATIYWKDGYDGSNDYGDYDEHQGFSGPLRFKPMTPGGIMPHSGGSIGQPQGGYFSAGGGDKSFWDLYDGQFYFEGFDISWVRGSGSPEIGLGGGRAGIRKNNATYGGIWINGCHIHDCDDGGLLDTNTGPVVVTNNYFWNCSGNTQSQGYTHSVYAAGPRLVWLNNTSLNVMGGHALKSRSRKNLVLNSRHYDGETGSASNQINLPEGGVNVVMSNVLQKGPNFQNPYALSQLEDYPVPYNDYFVDPRPDRSYITVVKNNTFLMETVGGSGVGPAVAIAIPHNLTTDYPIGMDGVRARYVIDGNSVFLGQGTSGFVDPSILDRDTNTTTLALPPKLDFTDPAVTLSPIVYPPAPHPFFGWIGGGYAYPNGSAVGQYLPSSNDFSVPAAATGDTLVATFAMTGIPSNAQVSPTDGGVDPWTNYGATVTIVQADEYFGGAVWAPVGAYKIVPTGNGSHFSIYATGSRPANTTDLIKVRAQTVAGAPKNWLFDWRFYIPRPAA